MTVVRPQPRTQSLDLSNHVVETAPLFSEKSSHITLSTPSDLFKSCVSTAQTSVDSPFESKLDEAGVSSSHSSKLINDNESPGFKESRTETISSVMETVGSGQENTAASVTDTKGSSCTVSSSTEVSSPKKQEVLLEQSERGSTGSAAVSEGDSGIDPCVEAGEEDGGPAGSEGSAADERRHAGASSRVEQPGKRKGEAFLNHSIWLLHTFDCLKVS